MAHKGTGWDGTEWEARAGRPETLGRRLAGAGGRLRKVLVVALFGALFPAIAIAVVFSNPTPASSGGCQAYTTIDNSIRSRTEALCNRPFDAERVYTYVIARNRTGRLGYETKTRAQEKFSVQSNRVNAGCTYYQGRGGVRGEDQNYSRTRRYNCG